MERTMFVVFGFYSQSIASYSQQVSTSSVSECSSSTGGVPTKTCFGQPSGKVYFHKHLCIGNADNCFTHFPDKRKKTMNVMATLLDRIISILYWNHFNRGMFVHSHTTINKDWREVSGKSVRGAEGRTCTGKKLLPPTSSQLKQQHGSQIFPESKVELKQW